MRGLGTKKEIIPNFILFSSFPLLKATVEAGTIVVSSHKNVATFTVIKMIKDLQRYRIRVQKDSQNKFLIVSAWI